MCFVLKGDIVVGVTMTEEKKKKKKKKKKDNIMNDRGWKSWCITLCLDES
jgi:hypothetical protein